MVKRSTIRKLFPYLLMVGAVVVFTPDYGLMSFLLNSREISLQARPNGPGSAAFVRESLSFAGSDFWVYVRDPSVPIPTWKLIGSYATDGREKLERAFWSKDGSLLVVVAELGEGGGKTFTKSYGMFFVAAYDFKSHRMVPDEEPRRAKWKRIAELVKQRGGEGTVALISPFLIEKSMTWSQSMEFSKK